MYMYGLLFSEGLKLFTCIAFCLGRFEAVHMYSLLFSEGLKLCTCIPFCSVRN